MKTTLGNGIKGLVTQFFARTICTFTNGCMNVLIVALNGKLGGI